MKTIHIQPLPIIGLNCLICNNAFGTASKVSVVIQSQHSYKVQCQKFKMKDNLFTVMSCGIKKKLYTSIIVCHSINILFPKEENGIQQEKSEETRLETIRKNTKPHCSKYGFYDS